MNRVVRFLRDTSAASAAEFALVLPLISVLLFGFFEAGRLFWSYNIVTNSARDAARFGARLPMANCTTGLTAVDQTKVKQLARTGTVDGSGSPLVPGWTSNASVQVSVTCVTNAALSKGRYEGLATVGIPRVSVIATAPYGALFGGLFPGLTLTAVAVGNDQPWTE